MLNNKNKMACTMVDRYFFAKFVIICSSSCHTHKRHIMGEQIGDQRQCYDKSSPVL